jgi:hypothetical protein
MARIDGPKLTSPGQVERKALEPLAVTTSAAALTSAKGEAPGSEFVDAKEKLISTTGGYRPVALPDALRADLKAFVAGQRRTSAPAGGTLSLKNGEAKAATKASTPAALEKELAQVPMDQLPDRLQLLPAGELAALGKAIAAGKVTNPRVVAAYLDQQAPADRAKAMSKMPAKQLEQMKALMRAGDCPDSVAVGVGIRMAAESKWGKANPAIVKTLQDSYLDGSIHIATTDAAVAGLGQTSASGIDVANQLRKSPEALAATLAHEGTHKHSGSGCCGAKAADATPQDEIDGMGASADVWGELHTADTNLAPKSLKMLNDLSDARKKPDGGTAFRDNVLGWYTKFYQDKRDAIGAKVVKGNEAYAASKKPGGKAMRPADFNRLMEQQSQLDYLEKTAETFRKAWAANK